MLEQGGHRQVKSGSNPPEPGQLVTVRDRQWVVADVLRGLQETDVLSGDGAGAEHLVSLVSVEDDAMGEEAQVMAHLVHTRSGGRSCRKWEK